MFLFKHWVSQDKRRSNGHEIIDEVYKALSSTGNTGKSKKSDTNVLMFSNFVNDTGYTGVKDKSSERNKRFIPKILPDRIGKFENRIVEESADVQSEVLKNIIPSKKFDIRCNSEALLGLKISGHTDTLTEPSNKIDEINKKGQIQTEQQYRNALHEFSTS